MTLALLAAISGPNPLPFALESLWYCRLAEGRLKAEEAFREAVANERKKADEQFQKVSTRETREGWPLPSVETEANGDSRSSSTHERGPSLLVGSLGLSCQYKRLLSCLGYSIRPSSKYIFLLTVHYFTSLVPLARQAGQAVVLRRPSLKICLWLLNPPPPTHNDISRKHKLLPEPKFLEVVCRSAYSEKVTFQVKSYFFGCH
jgi:hypothetical protein